ncbi:hypothetical protein L8W40_02735 [Campylobacter sp. IFREMER_LSEM_CL1846]|nr:hypothetical protein [Campylobacter sp. IFREMER_LSEM_CL1846]HEC1748530.1 hypothetical protein [Campylobacter lari]MCV3433975.1 hypothetical protein [Campylobacter sp. IFREMER_LSEM_CL1846]HEC1769093.1 hypothetical protein [Campylobacter lari]HEC1789578.1 hypothetical protein [Campylobacter lari]HEC1795784.1 hypothetical protein [Campylobacter lari]
MNVNTQMSVKNKLSIVVGVIVFLALSIITIMAFVSSRNNLISNSKQANEDYLLITET